MQTNDANTAQGYCQPVFGIGREIVSCFHKHRLLLKLHFLYTFQCHRCDSVKKGSPMEQLSSLPTIGYRAHKTMCVLVMLVIFVCSTATCMDKKRQQTKRQQAEIKQA